MFKWIQDLIMNNNNNNKCMGNPASHYCNTLEYIKNNITLETKEGASSIIVFNDNKWDNEWNLYREKLNKGKYLWLVNIDKSLLNSSRYLHFQDDIEISKLKLKCNEIHADFALINSGYLCKEYPYEKRGAVCILKDNTIIHASILLEEDWEYQIEILKASITV